MIRNICLSSAAMAAALGVISRCSAQNVSYAETVSAGVPLKVICVNLNDPNVKVTGILTQHGAGHSEPFGTLIGRTHPTVAITGTFFGISNKIPVGDIVIDGQLAHFGGLGTAICVTDNNEVEFIRPKMYRHTDWSKYDFVLCCGPRLVTDGIPYVEPWTEGFKDKHMLNRNGRLAVGITKNHELMFVATRKPVYLSKLAKAMRGIGIVDGINLDAGSSMGLHYKGRTLLHPSRQLTNLILVYDNKDRYYELKERLLPLAMRSASARKTEKKAVATSTTPAKAPAITTLLPSAAPVSTPGGSGAAPAPGAVGYPETGNK